MMLIMIIYLIKKKKFSYIVIETVVIGCTLFLSAFFVFFV